MRLGSMPMIRAISGLTRVALIERAEAGEAQQGGEGEDEHDGA